MLNFLSSLINHPETCVDRQASVNTCCGAWHYFNIQLSEYQCIVWGLRRAKGMGEGCWLCEGGRELWNQSRPQRRLWNNSLIEVTLPSCVQAGFAHPHTQEIPAASLLFSLSMPSDTKDSDPAINRNKLSFSAWEDKQWSVLLIGKCTNMFGERQNEQQRGNLVKNGTFKQISLGRIWGKLIDGQNVFSIYSWNKLIQYDNMKLLVSDIKGCLTSKFVMNEYPFVKLPACWC